MKKNFSILLKQFIKSSPRSRAVNRNGVLPPEFQINTNKLPTNDQYVKNFIVHLDVSYMYQYYGPSTINDHKKYLHKNTFVNPLENGIVRTKSIQINDLSLDRRTVLFELIKSLNKDKTSLRYTELQQFLTSLTMSEIKQFKKFIVYLYKWLLNEKYKLQGGSIQHELCQQTSEIIINKIYQIQDVQFFKSTEQQIFVIENLEKARQNKRLANFQAAKQGYEIVFMGPSDNQQKLQALQFLCHQNIQTRNLSSLNKLAHAIKQAKGQLDQEKLVQSAISEVTKLTSTVQEMEVCQQPLIHQSPTLGIQNLKGESEIHGQQQRN